MLTDSECYNLFLKGDTAAYDELMLRYGDSLTYYLYGYLHDWHDAEDMMIEAFARIMAKRPRIGEGAFKAYLFKTGRNLELRLQSRKKRSEVFDPENIDMYQPAGEYLEEHIIKDEMKEALMLCLGRIDPAMSEALWLVYIERMSYSQAAEVMKVNTKKVDHLLTNGKKRMREELGKEGIERI